MVDISKKVGVSNSTLTGWKNAKDNYKKVLYEVLKALPVEFVEGVKKNLKRKRS